MGDDVNKKAKELILQVLRHKLIASLNFVIGSEKVWPAMYEDVAKAIENGKIAVMVDTGGDAAKQGIGAVYLNEWKISKDSTYYNVLVLPRADLGSNINEQFHQIGYIVHECTHAAYDLHKIAKLTHVHNESVAFVAGSVFQVLLMLEKRGRPQDVKMPNGIEKEAWDIARTIASGQTASKQQVNALAVAISNDPNYKDKAQKIVPNDGVNQKWLINGKLH